MAGISNERREWHRLATENAKRTLKVGDRITFTSCPGTKRWAIVTGWDGVWICSKTRNDIAAATICTLNGQPVSFARGPRPD
ncbi:hypothetical protein [Sphingomonas alpina]|uniref:Uncharacterized protein n=1 Tax=Sphingomonas alpina TaxID=653931 RepID=A0A7H0LHW9_9SPHN|nr:hypothetical protein [Sphingomonas alpina]QNQ09272.1 hypothetical protein H3Z74_21800 [Sphingomonas alpina]